MFDTEIPETKDFLSTTYQHSLIQLIISRRSSIVPQTDSSIRPRLYVCMCVCVYVTKCVQSRFSEMAECFFNPPCSLIASML